MVQDDILFIDSPQCSVHISTFYSVHEHRHYTRVLVFPRWKTDLTREVREGCDQETVVLVSEPAPKEE
jgi:hypothetical protein